ncbi:M1 family metallopeptidase [Algoriphagus sp. D3-2-R+10]|uniref:M1 family metallopeptidase n=1 Tax=Algoriphagus aurantiacus TaxID=3103948 RepID=UPI002B3E4BE3|nr:M1 family metallopeptidase [Algoriphagus sp. D3-2-R+10]MEB2775652.1 M1 family metallopeptidase [Algoriphagus sp. D3-2-R+10]
MNQLSVKKLRIRGYSFAGQIIFFLVFAIACKSAKIPDQGQSENPIIEIPAEEKLVDSAALVADTSREEKADETYDYNPSAKKDFDILHTDLDLSFEYQRQAVIGKAELTIKPFFYPTRELVLDAQDFEFDEIFFIQAGKRETTTYNYDEEKIHIYLPRELTRADTFRIVFDYIAFPERNGGGGSEAITDTKGLYFIDPLDTIPDKPTMIWTQGETAHNSKWFPTIDSPNNKFTQLIKLTVSDTLVTIGNGELVKQEVLSDGMRKDYWEMKLPHSAYLAAFAVGDFGKVEANWEDVPLGYYVEKGYEEGAKKVFKNTPEMIGFFSDLLGVRYPWPKYDQIVVRDFVSGAMENTTASIFMEELRLTEREAIDSEWDYIIAHELFHQWFGDYVTAESWANLTLNEGFANYSEFLWNEYKYGSDEAKLKLIAEMENYFMEAETKQVDLIRFDYEDAEDMFDSHSYSKGGAILHMLREYLGTEAFYASLKVYLEEHAFDNVEVNDLRIAFEKVSGEDLNWFFDQWFLDKGHPELNFDVDYSDPKSIIISVSQEQDLTTKPLYQLPLEVSWYEEKERKSKRFMITEAFQQVSVESENPINLILIDEQKNLLAEKSIEMDANQMRQQFRVSKFGIARYEALDSLAAWEAVTELESILPEALDDEFWSIRESALSILQGYPEWLEDTPELARKIANLAENDPRNSVRAGAIDVLSAFSPDDYYSTFLELAKGSSYLVAGSALMGLVSMESQKVDSLLIESYASENNFRMVIPVADYYITKAVAGKGDWFLNQANTISGEGLYYFFGYLSEYFSRFPEEGEEDVIDFLLAKMGNDKRSYIRLGAFQGLLGFSDDPEILKKISEVAAHEMDSNLIMYYQNFLEAMKGEN